MIPALPTGFGAVLLALAGAALLLALRNARAARIGAILIPLICLGLLARAAAAGLTGPDPAALPLAMLAAFVAFTAAIAVPADAVAAPVQAASLAALLLAVLADNIFLGWLGCVGAAAGVMTVASTRSAALPVLLMLALLGTVLLALAAQPALGPGLAPLGWSALLPLGGRCNPALLGLAFAFLLVGYGGVAGLVPLQGWLPGGALVAPFTNIGLLMLLRLRVLLAGNPAAISPGPALMALGLASLLLGGAALWRRPDGARLTGWIGIWQAGLAAFAFGLGGPGSVFAGLLQMVLRTLSVASCEHALRAGGTQPMRHRGLAWATGAALVTAAALPPAGSFTSLLLIATETLARLPLLALPLAIGVVAGAIGILAALHARWPGGTGSGPAPDRPTVAVIWVHVVLGMLLGLVFPGALSAWLRAG